MPPVFAFGLGCQKGGTSWLHAYLAASPSCDPGFRKEYHVFDGLDLPSEAWMRGRVLRRAASAVEALQEGRPANVDALRQASFYADQETYFDYFASLLARPGVDLTGDITPSYALLSAERLRSVGAGFAERGIATVPIFLMRDPVERIWSMVRMNQQRRPDDFPGPTEEWVRRLYTQDDHALRTRYDLTLAALSESFPAGDPWFAFYERLFDRDVLADLCARLGISFHEPELGQVVNASPKGSPLPDDLVAEMAAHFRCVYDTVAARFPDVDLEHLWPSARHL
ncbi:sulfotransferase [Nocardioides bigeumensis]|uniref:Sulfotransferase family protein n=1 Tax=Nocardioides bigeumensis TaxID=433657 RepID=A0ABP5KMV3_9ACTN